jgi:hypothetical protein
MRPPHKKILVLCMCAITYFSKLSIHKQTHSPSLAPCTTFGLVLVLRMGGGFPSQCLMCCFQRVKPAVFLVTNDLFYNTHRKHCFPLSFVPRHKFHPSCTSHTIQGTPVLMFYWNGSAWVILFCLFPYVLDLSFMPSLVQKTYELSIFPYLS